MCKAPKPPKPKEPKKPEFLRNRYLDDFVGQAGMVKSLRAGRATFRVPLGSPSGIGGRQPGESLVPAGTAPTTSTPTVSPRPIGPRGNPRNPNRPREHTR
jgi:hypothetical protein